MHYSCTDAIRIGLHALDHTGRIRITCRDGARFEGMMTHAHAQYIILSGAGYPLDDIVDIEII